MKMDSAILQRFLKLASSRLRGKWVVMGGTVLPLLGIEYRVTNDIDLAGPRTASQEDTLILMGIAEELHLPVEAINQAGAFFLFKIPDWESHLIEVFRGKSATFFRPDTTLFCLLKIPRLSESDFDDCVQMLKFDSKTVEVSRLVKEISKHLKENPSEGKATRLSALKKMVLGRRD